MTPQEFYALQSPITDPEVYGYLYDALPRDIPSLCRVVQGLVLHYVADKQLVGGSMPYERLCEVDTRYVSHILARLLEMDNHPLTETRTPENRIVGCCRDFSVLFCSMLRHFGIPARTRSGFSAYFEKGYFGDHVIVEYWNGTHWQFVDAQLPSESNWGIEVTNVPRDQFVVAGMGWQMCRNGQADPERFGLGSASPLRGMWFIRGRLLQDLAALNKHEMLCWDQWSYGAESVILTDDDEMLLDQVAKATQGGDASFAEVRALFEDERLRAPKSVMSWSPAQGKEVEVNLRI
jgi:hypothetical protein